MKPTLQEREELAALRVEQEQYVAGQFSTGKAEYNKDYPETRIVFPSDAKIVFDWNLCEKGELDCVWLGLPLPAELSSALKMGGFKTLFLSQEEDEDMQDAIHEILTLKDKRYPGKGVYHYPDERAVLLAHPWSEEQTSANTIYAAWLKNARAQISGKPEADFISTEARESFVKAIPGFTPKKGMNKAWLRKLGHDPDKIAKQVAEALRKARRENDRV